MLTQLLVLLALPAAALHPLVTDDTGTQGRRRGQLELGLEKGHDREPGEHQKRLTGGWTLAFGASDTLDAQLSLPLERTSLETSEEDEEGMLMRTLTRASGAGDAVLEMKWRFLERDGSSLALKPGLSLPTGDHRKGLGSGVLAGKAGLLATQRLGRFALHANAGYAYNNNREGERLNLWRVSAAVEASVAGPLRLLLDSGVERSSLAGEPNPAYALAGIVVSPVSWLDLDAGLKRGLTRSEEDLTWLVGTSLRF